MDKNYITLEFNKVLNEIFKYLKLEKSIEKFNIDKLYKNKSELEDEFKIIEDTIYFNRYDNGFDLTNLNDIDTILQNLNILGSYLNVEDLVNVLKIFTTYRISKTRVKNLKEKYKYLYKVFDNDIDFSSLEKILLEILDGNDIRDTASLGLRDIRYQKKLIIQNIKEKIDDIFSNKDLQKAVSEKIQTIRNERIVISVKTDFKYLIKGIEHDKSSSGSTTYIEPLNIVSLNNKLREYEAREREEIRKILIRISDLIREEKHKLHIVYDKLLYIDMLNAKSNYSIDNNLNIPKIANKDYINLIDARHPLIDEAKFVPLTFSIGEEKNILIITGPNTGGKTITIKTAGLLTLMTLLAIPIPASEKSEIGIFDKILVDIGDEQSIEQNLSSFSAHVKNISNILNESTNKSLVLLDEIGSGTDPIEGSSFAMAIIDYLKDKNTKVIVSTHYSELKYHSINDEKIETASMEFDIESLRPTYKLIVGIPGESNALIIASNYGINNEIIEKAKQYISDENKKIDKIIVDLKKQSKEIEEYKLEIETIKNEQEKLKQEYEEKIMVLEEEKNQILLKTHKEADEYLKNMQNKVKNIIDKINKEETKKEELSQIQKNINMIRASIEEDKKIKVKKVVNTNKLNYNIGDTVLVKTLNQKAKILKIINENSYQVQAGILKMVVDFSDLEKINEKKENKVSFTPIRNVKSVKNEIDVRGMIAEDAIYEIEMYLDSAVLNGYNQVYIIHGKGTMVLRKKIHEFLKKSRYIKNFENAMPSEGGLGCTVVYLK